MPLALDPNPRMVLARALDPKQLATLGVFWSFVILPQLLPRRTQAKPPTVVGSLVRRVAFLVLLFAIVRIANRLGVILV